MLETKDLSIKIGDNYIVEGLSLVLNRGDKLAIIGEEGNGKSTLLKAILGELDYGEVSGAINLQGNRIGYLEQSIKSDNPTLTVLEYLFKTGDDYYSKVADLYGYIDSFKLMPEILARKVDALSGGEKVKIGILRLLLNDFDILFLDEPTNDLDIETLRWLEEFIACEKRPIMYVSHDETLLSKTANVILHIERIEKKTACRHTLLKMDYDTYVEKRSRQLARQTQMAKSEKREFAKKQEKLQRILQKVEYQQNTISRSDPFGAKLLKKKMHSLKSQEKKLESTKLTEIPDVEEAINFFFEDVFMPKTKVILSLDLPEVKVQDRVLSRDVKLDIVGNVHLCIVGSNGVGKSTLIKIIYEKLKDRSDIEVGYMPQNYDDILDGNITPLDFLAPKGSNEEKSKASTFLSSMNFTRTEVTGKIAQLSNGTKAKLLLVKLVLDRCNVLILDEPTRNTSPLSNPIIRKILKEFKGTIIAVSHDRKFIEEAIDQVYLLSREGLKEYK